MSAADINFLCQLWAAMLAPHGDSPPFSNHAELYKTIDATSVGGVPWQSVSLSYNTDGPRPENPPTWMDNEYTIWFRDPHLLFKNMLENTDFAKAFDYTPQQYSYQLPILPSWLAVLQPDHQNFNKQQYANGIRRYENFMSGDWAWKQADIIAKNPATHGAMFVPVILGSVKTTVSVATGHNEYWPLYGSIGNIHNDIRQAHGAGLVLIGFLSIPKTNNIHSGCPHFRQFRWKLYHFSLLFILELLRPGETTPELITDCQVGELWDKFGIIPDVVPFTNDFERTNIHELLAPDLLHQLIKGTFQDHLVLWVKEYVYANNHPKAKTDAIMDDIDRRIAIVPAFSGLQHFSEGRGFKQWTGDDSKALMKEPWRHSNRNEALGQMLVTNQQLDQLAAAQTDFESHGMLNGTCLGATLEALVTITTTLAPNSDSTDEPELAPALNNTRQDASIPDEDPNNEIVDDDHVNVLTEVKLSSTIYILEDSYPQITGKIFVFNSAIATFYAPSNISGVTGMRREHIWATSSWRRGAPRYDCVLINSHPDIDGACGFEIAHIFLFFSFECNRVVYRCALVQWFSFVGIKPDEETGLWKVEPDLRDSGEPHFSIIHINKPNEFQVPPVPPLPSSYAPMLPISVNLADADSFRRDLPPLPNHPRAQLGSQSSWLTSSSGSHTTITSWSYPTTHYELLNLPLHEQLKHLDKKYDTLKDVKECAAEHYEVDFKKW
ncbi:hypothetical protein BYT27DRAFT_7259320 [Phlegmacium glaucopus]|nr:hypothetical protein BYT27DRAFT_7259320 [Phlegmacium glaucopus]